MGSLTPPRWILVQNLYEILFILLSYRLSKYAPSQKKRLSCDFATKPLRYSTIRRLLALWSLSLRLVEFYHQRWISSRQRRFRRLEIRCTTLRPYRQVWPRGMVVVASIWRGRWHAPAWRRERPPKVLYYKRATNSRPYNTTVLSILPPVILNEVKNLNGVWTKWA